MSTLFFYGTLRHVPLLEIVLGRALAVGEMSRAMVQGFSVRNVQNEDFPIIIQDDSASQAEGLILRDLSEVDVARLNFYEGGFDYQLRQIAVQSDRGSEQAQVYFPEPGKWTPVDQWSLTSWQEKWGELTCFAAKEAMTYFGTRTDAEFDFMFPMIRVRAAAKVNAAADNPAYSPSGFTRDDVTDLGTQRPFTGFFGIEEHNFSFRQYDGKQSAPVKREIFAGTDASIVLPYDPIRDRVMLVEQFRPGPYARNDATPWMLEPIAGRVDAGETPEETAYREAEEEAGITLSDLHVVAKAYASPGCSTEYFNIFVGAADLPDDIVGINGLESEAEDIKSYLFSFDELMTMIDTQQAANTPLVLAGLWLARHRDRLRSMA